MEIGLGDILVVHHQQAAIVAVVVAAAAGRNSVIIECVMMVAGAAVEVGIAAVVRIRGDARLDRVAKPVEHGCGIASGNGDDVVEVLGDRSKVQPCRIDGDRTLGGNFASLGVRRGEAEDERRGGGDARGEKLALAVPPLIKVTGGPETCSQRTELELPPAVVPMSWTILPDVDWPLAPASTVRSVLPPLSSSQPASRLTPMNAAMLAPRPVRVCRRE
jgi:hypothetical protein